VQTADKIYSETAKRKQSWLENVFSPWSEI